MSKANVDLARRARSSEPIRHLLRTGAAVGSTETETRNLAPHALLPSSPPHCLKHLGQHRRNLQMRVRRRARSTRAEACHPSLARSTVPRSEEHTSELQSL